MRNSDSRREVRREERQRAIAGKLPFHRVSKWQKMLKKISSKSSKNMLGK